MFADAANFCCNNVLEQFVRIEDESFVEKIVELIEILAAELAIVSVFVEVGDLNDDFMSLLLSCDEEFCCCSPSPFSSSPLALKN